MTTYTEEQLKKWTKPPSDSEENKLENSQRMVRDAINSAENLKGSSIEIFGQGSYANNTNVRVDSDIDINVCYTDCFYYKLPAGKTGEDFRLTNSCEYSYSEFKNDVETALISKFGRKEVTRKDKCITIKGNSYRIETDVVPTWNYRRYSENGKFVSGTKFQSDKGIWIVNFPKQHIENGIKKNNDTHRRFKRLTRLHRKLRYKMIDAGEIVSDNITSFLLECLVWNVPNEIMNNNDTWTDRLRESIIHIYEKTEKNETCKDWGEVSESLYLFHDGRKWSYKDVNSYMQLLWQHLAY